MTLQFGRHPAAMTIFVVRGDPLTLVATNSGGWTAPVQVKWYVPGLDDPVVVDDATTIDGDRAEWVYTPEQVLDRRADASHARLVHHGVTESSGPVNTTHGWEGVGPPQTIATLHTGPAGKSAYQVALDNGFEGTEAEWLASLAATIDPATLQQFIEDYLTDNPPSGGVTTHSDLDGRDGADQHPIGAVTGLQDALDDKADTDHNHDGTYATTAQGNKADTAVQPAQLAAETQARTDADTALATDIATKVPTSRTVNDKPLSANVTLTASDVGAATPAQVSAGDSATLAAAQSHAQGLVDALTAASPATLDTLAEIAAALGEDPNFAATMTAALANRVRFDAAQSLTVPQQAQARTNIGAAPALGPDDNYVTDAEKAALHGHSNKAALDLVSGENTGDQDLSGYAQTSSLGSAAEADTGDFATAAQGDLADTALQVATAQPINAQTGAYTLVAADAGKMVKMTLAAAADLTVPANVFTAGQRVDIADRGTARVTVLAGAGMTVNPPAGGSLVMEGQYSAASLFFWSATEADLIGLVAAS